MAATPQQARSLTSVVIVAADSGPLLRRCVDSVLTSDVPVEVVLVDNASGDGEPDRTSADHAHDERMRLLVNSSNRGFGSACNQGAAIAKGDVLLFLNPDCELPNGALGRLRALLDDDASIGLLGACVCTPDGVLARGSRRRDPTVARAIVSMLGLQRLWPALKGVEMPREQPESAATSIERVDAISGACMMMPRAVFQRLGGFDEGYFLHAEDLDLCRRTRDLGYDVVIGQAVKIVHAQGSSSHGRQVFVAYHKHRGMWRYFRKFDPLAGYFLVRSAVWLGLWSHFFLMLPVYAVRQRAYRPRS